MASLFEFSNNLQEKAKAFERVFNACNILLSSKEAEETRDILLKRTQGNIDCWKFGYWPKDNEMHLLLKLVSEEDLLLTDLVYKKEHGLIDYGACSDLFGRLSFHNLIIPYKNLYGDILGFVGRTNSTSEDQKKLKISKYKNTKLPKALNLFGFFESKQSIIENDSVIIVEGQFDCITSHRFGYTNTVALGSASLTNYQFFLIKRYTNNIKLLLDNDFAGTNESNNIIARFGNSANISKINIPEGYKDIDEFLNSGSQLKLVS